MINKIKLAFYFFAKILGVFALARHLTASKVRILCYHGGSIGDEWKYNGKLFMTRKKFEKRVAWLQIHGYQISSLSEAVAFSISDENPPRLVTALTFDDGWYSTGRELLPVLSESKLPATLYLCTSHFEEAWPIFDVTVRYILWRVEGRKIEIKGFDNMVDGAYDLKINLSRKELIAKIMNLLAMQVKNRAQALSTLNRFAAAMGGVPGGINLESRRFDYLSADELRELAANGCAIELHGHFHSYPAGNPEQFFQDLTTCGSIIEKLGLPKPKHYCYPSGDFDSAAAAVLQKLEIDSATTCIPGLIESAQGNRKYYLPRFLDGENVHMLEFEAEISGFSDVLRRAVGRSQAKYASDFM